MGRVRTSLVVIKYNELSLIKKKHKNKRELKTETRNDPLTTHIRTQMNTYEHWSQRPIRRSVPTGDDRQAPEQRRHNKGESQRQNCIHPVQGRVSPFPAFHSYPPFLSSPRIVDRGSYIQGTDIKKPTKEKDNPHLFPLHHSRIEPTPSQHIDFIFLIRKKSRTP